MRTVGLRELRQNASALVRLAEAGETIRVTVQGREAAFLTPPTQARPKVKFMDGHAFWLAMRDAPPPDPDWQDDLRALRDMFEDELIDPWERA